MNTFIRYYGFFLWLLLFWYISIKERYLVTKQEHISGKVVTRYTWIFALLVIVPLVYFAATRNNFGDTLAYKRGFSNSVSSFAQIPEFLKGIKKDKAFYLFAAIWRTILGDRVTVYFGIIALFQLFCLVNTFRKYTPYFLTALFIFVASTDYLSYMHNGIRQFVAVCMIFSCSKWIFEKKYLFSIFTVLVASLFHQSALLMIPVIFIVQGEPWNKSTVLFMIIALGAVFFVDRFTNIMDNLLSETQYSNVVSDWTSWNDNGTNPIRVLVYSVPMLLSIIGLRFIREAEDPVINVCVNMSIICSGLFIISMATSGIYVGRLPIYVSLYSNCILLPWEIEHLFSKQSASFIRTVMIILFMLFYYYQTHIAWSIV